MPVEDLINQPTIVVRPWPDPVVEAAGHDPRSPYVERFWLGLLGPSATWLLRRLVAGLEACPGGYELDLAVTAAALGLGTTRGRGQAFARSFGRLARFGALHRVDDAEVAVRRKIAPLTRSQVRRLPPEVQAEHDRWLARHGEAGREAGAA